MFEIEKRISNFEKLKKEHNKIENIVFLIKDTLLNGNKLFFCGNGGSASDSNHIACEFVSKFQKKSCVHTSIFYIIAHAIAGGK